MGDPREGRTAEGMIATGASVDRIPAKFDAVLAAAVRAVGSAAPDASILLYGSVATGQAEVGRSDVDLLVIGLAADHATAISAELSERFADRCRAVAVGAAEPDAFVGDHDEAYGNRVFLRHYCVLLAGSGRHVPTDDFPADRRAARGFNGDIARHRDRWRSELSASTDRGDFVLRVARKMLLAVAGLVSVHDDTWTTDRATAAARWSQIDPGRSDDLATLLDWTADPPIVSSRELERMLDELVDPLVDRFAHDIGLWP